MNGARSSRNSKAECELNLNQAAETLTDIAWRKLSKLSPEERERRLRAVEEISTRVIARKKAATKLADIFLEHDLDNGLSLAEIKRKTRMIENWAPSKPSAHDIRPRRASQPPTRPSPARSRISA